jgi:hypothetical protein
MSAKDFTGGMLLMLLGIGLIVGSVWFGWKVVEGVLMLTIIFGYGAVGAAAIVVLLALSVIAFGLLLIWTGGRTMDGKA